MGGTMADGYHSSYCTSKSPWWACPDSWFLWTMEFWDRTNCFKPRMRAAVFINAVAIREAVSLKHGLILTKECRDKLCTANYLFHSALNCHFVRILDLQLCFEELLWESVDHSIMKCKHWGTSNQGLACEAISKGKLLWKIRPKIHK